MAEPVRIECLARRPGGTTVRLGGKRYHFRPEEGIEAHTALVANATHVARMLSIREGYRRYTPPPEEGEDLPGDQQQEGGEGTTVDPTLLSDAALEKLGVSAIGEWARRYGVNPTNKASINRWAKQYGVDLDNRKNETNLLRELAAAFRDRDITLELPQDRMKEQDASGEED